MKKRWLALLLAVVMVMSTVAGCAPKEETVGDDGQKEAQKDNGGSDSDVIKIGIFEPLTGANAAGGELEVEGIELANELYPEVLGKKVELVKADNKSDKAEAATAASRLLEKDKVNAIIGSWGSSLAMAAGDPVRNAKVPAVGASCTNPNVTLGNDYYFRVCFIDQFQGKILAQYAYDKLGARKVAIIQEVSNDYSVGLTKFFSDPFKELTGDPNCIVEVTKYNTGDQDFTAQLQNIKAKNPDLIFAPGNYTESALIIKQARQAGIKTPFLGADTWETPQFIEVGGDAVEGAMMSTFFDSEKPINDEGKKFIDAYRAKYPGKEPAAVTALGYDAYILILDAIKRAGSADPQAIRDELAKTKDFQGAAGAVTLNENGDAEKDAIIKVVKDGKFVYKDTVKKQD